MTNVGIHAVVVEENSKDIYFRRTGRDTLLVSRMSNMEIEALISFLEEAKILTLPEIKS